MAIDLTKLQPHRVSRDLSGYITYVYGAPKTGKTTFAARAEKCLILACEKGYSALDNVIAQDINSWSDIRAVLRELKKPEVKELYDVVAIDTIDIAAKYCEKYICSQNDVEDLSDIPYGRAYKSMREEFEDVFNTMAKLGYAIVFISHDQVKTLTREDGTTYDRITPSLAPDKVNAIIENMVDIYGYAHLKITNDDNPNQVMLTLRDNTGMISCGSRFKFIANEIPFTYESLTKAVQDAIDKKESGYVLPKSEDVTVDSDIQIDEPTLNFAELKKEFNSLVKKLQTESNDFPHEWAPKIVAITDSVLGKGKKVNDLNDSQVELLEVIVGELKSEMQN